MRIDGPQITGSFSIGSTSLADLGNFATTGSNTFTGTQTLSGSVIPAVNNTYDLGSPTNQFRHVYISSGSLYVNGTKVLGASGQELQVTTDAGQSFKILETGADTITLQSSDGNVTLTSTGGGDIVIDPNTGVIGLKGTITVYTGNKITSSDGNSIQFGNGIAVTGSIVSTATPLISGSGQISGLGFATTGSNTFNGNLTVTGYIDAQELRTTYISSSILYRSGSTKFGDDLLDTHAFTGSLSVSGSISVPGSGLVSGSSQIVYSGLTSIPSGLVSGSSQVLSGTGIWSGSAQLPSGTISGSVQVISSLPSGTISGSAQVSITGTTGFGTYLNQAVLTTSNPTFNSVVADDHRMTGTGYITYDTSNAGTNSLTIRKYGTTVAIFNSSGYVGINRTDPAFYLDVYANTANTFYTIAQFENRDYTSGTRTFIRVRNWLTSGGSYSSYFGQGQDGKTYIISNNSARGGDIIIDGGNGYVGIGMSPSYILDVNGTTRVTALSAGNATITSSGELQFNSSAINIYTYGRTGLANAGRILFNNGTAANLFFGEIASNIYGFTGGGYNSAPTLTMDMSNYYVGIGTASPAYNLDIQGSEAKIQLKNTSTGGGTWVMASTYNSWSAGGGKYVITSDGGTAGIKFSINSSGQVGINTYSQSARFEVKAAADEDLIIGRYSGGSAKLFYVYQSSADGYLELRTGADTTVTKLSGYAGTPAFMNTKLTVYGTSSYSASALAVEGTVKVNRSMYSWYQSGTNSWDGYAYLHLKTNMWAGGSPSGNIHYTMSLFYCRLYSYSSSYIREGHMSFHNWSGTIYSNTTTGTAWSNAYTSSDGYVVLVVALGSGTYLGVTVDWHQAYGYPFQDKIVTAASPSNSATGAY